MLVLNVLKTIEYIGLYEPNETITLLSKLKFLILIQKIKI